MFPLTAIQQALVASRLDGWLLYDFRGSNAIARRVLQLEDRPAGSRRLFYCIPARGTPCKLVHRIEPGALDHLPGQQRTYLRWQELEEALGQMVAGMGTLAMEYAPGVSNPYLARVDAGTVECVRGLGPTVVSSGDLVQRFEASWDEAQWQMHLAAAQITTTAFDAAFGFIADQVRRGGKVTESAVIGRIGEHFAQHGAVADHDPIVAVNRHSGDPHYQTTPQTDAPIGEGDFVLIDLWCKLADPRAVYSDLTRVGFVGQRVPEKYETVFQIVAAARDAAIDCVRSALAADRPLCGWEVDRAARGVIEQAGYGDFFVHRTGHSIGREIHGNGANMDDLETHDQRHVIPGTCFSIEPGIYLPEFGVRSEVNVYIDPARRVHVTGGPPQTGVLPILATR